MNHQAARHGAGHNPYQKHHPHLRWNAALMLHQIPEVFACGPGDRRRRKQEREPRCGRPVKVLEQARRDSNSAAGHARDYGQRLRSAYLHRVGGHQDSQILLFTAGALRPPQD